MKILYITTVNPRAQGDFQEVMILNGLRSIIGDSCVDFPRKKVMYGDYSETPKTELHGSGFTLYTIPLNEIKDEVRNLENIDFVLYGVTNAYGITDYPEINNLTNNVWYIDGHDHDYITKKPCFKRELFNDEEGVYPTGFGIPHYQLRPINLNKTQLFQKTAPYHSLFKEATDLGTRFHHIFNNEEEYFDDMSNSWFGLTSKKGGWDSLRHYEIMASGSLLLFRDYDKKPKQCSPQNLPCFSYSSMEELEILMNRLVVDNKPTDEYLEMLFLQREWLLKYGTTEARALSIIKTMIKNKKNKMPKKVVAFHSYQLGERGTEIHMYNLAKYNRDILGNESIIISTSSRPTPTLSMFEKEFKTFLYPDVWIPDGVNLNLRTSIEKICEENKITHFWATKGGESDGIMPTNAKSIAACIFRMDEPHGDIYSGICEYISNKHGGGFPYVYPIIEKEFPDYTDDFREELNIPKEALVFGRHGGKDSFSLSFAKDAIIDSLNKRDDIYFLFLNTDVFINHPRVIHIGWSPDFKLKSKFVNTCDAMIHARYDGEIFSQAVAEFSVRNKPILTWKPDFIPSHYDTGHIWVLGDNAFYYRDGSELINILTSISKNDFIGKDWDVYKDKYSAENVMRDFDRIFLS